MNRTRTPGFSLIELLVSIGIIAVLIGLLLPALGKARTSSRVVQALSNAHTVATSFEQYTGDYEVYPHGKDSVTMSFGGLGENAIQLDWWPEGTRMIISEPWAMEWAWPGFVKAVAPWEENYPVWVSPGMPTELPDSDDIFGDDDEVQAGIQISWRYANAFLADPKLWSDGAEADPKLVRPTRPSDVGFPSAKVLLWDTHLAYLRREPDIREGHWDAATPMAFADGHADTHNPLDATAGASNPLAGGRAMRLHDTPDGLMGRDY